MLKNYRGTQRGVRPRDRANLGKRGSTSTFIGAGGAVPPNFDKPLDPAPSLWSFMMQSSTADPSQVGAAKRSKSKKRNWLPVVAGVLTVSASFYHYVKLTMPVEKPKVVIKALGNGPVDPEAQRKLRAEFGDGVIYATESSAPGKPVSVAGAQDPNAPQQPAATVAASSAPGQPGAAPAPVQVAKIDPNPVVAPAPSVAPLPNLAPSAPAMVEPAPAAGAAGLASGTQSLTQKSTEGKAGDASPTGAQAATATGVERGGQVARAKPKAEVRKRPTESVALAAFLMTDAARAVDEARIDDAIKNAREVLRIQPRHDAALQLLVALLVEQGRLREARVLLAERIEHGPVQNTHVVTLARLVLEGGDATGAIAVLQRHAAVGATDPAYHGFVGGLLQRVDRHSEAAEALAMAAKLAPGRGAYWFGLAASQEFLGERANAADSYRRARLAGGLGLPETLAIERRLTVLASAPEGGEAAPPRIGAVQP